MSSRVKFRLPQYKSGVHFIMYSSGRVSCISDTDSNDVSVGYFELSPNDTWYTSPLGKTRYVCAANDAAVLRQIYNCFFCRNDVLHAKGTTEKKAHIYLAHITKEGAVSVIELNKPPTVYARLITMKRYDTDIYLLGVEEWDGKKLIQVRREILADLSERHAP